MKPPQYLTNMSPCDILEAINAISTACRIARLTLQSSQSIYLERLLSHDALSSLLRMSANAKSNSIRLAATKAVCLILPYTPPHHGSHCYEIGELRSATQY
jgi:hypothetical protein